MTALNMILILLAFASIVMIVVRDKAVGDRFPMSRALSLLTIVFIVCATWLQLNSPFWSIPGQMSSSFHPQLWLYFEIIFDLYVFIVLFGLDLRRRKAEGSLDLRLQPASEVVSLGALKSLVGSTREPKGRPLGNLANIDGRKLVFAVIVVMMPVLIFVAHVVVHRGLLDWLTPEQGMGLGVLLSFCLMEFFWLTIYYEQRILEWR
jgi:hypothetical protein